MLCIYLVICVFIIPSILIGLKRLGLNINQFTGWSVWIQRMIYKMFILVFRALGATFLLSPQHSNLRLVCLLRTPGNCFQNFGEVVTLKCWRSNDLLYDLLPVQYTELTHQLRKFLLYIPFLKQRNLTQIYSRNRIHKCK